MSDPQHIKTKLDISSDVRAINSPADNDITVIAVFEQNIKCQNLNLNPFRLLD